MAYTINQIFHTSMVWTYGFTLFKTFNLDLPRSKTSVGDFDPGMLKYVTIWNVKMMMREGLRTVFHVIATALFFFATYYGFLVLHVPKEATNMFSGYGGKFKFFTFWDVILQAIFFLICMLNDWFGTNAVNPKKPPLIRKFKDYLHASLGFPTATFVSLVFWILMFIDRELVFPKVLDPYFPWWLNHLLHSMVLVSTLIEMVIAPRQYPRRLTGLSTVVIFDFIYLVWVHVVHSKSGVWVYPLLHLMSTPVRLLFLGSMMVVSAILYLAGEAIHNLVWGNEQNKQQQKSHAKSK